jgi:cystathionine beta-lyase/cystathionine gamma-synthase
MAQERSARGFSTRAIRAATTAPVVDQRPNAVPLYLSATFSAGDADELGAVLTGSQPGYAYARIDNPTGTALADALAEMEGAEAARVFASGMAAIHAALASVLRSGDRVLATSAIYGSTRSLLLNQFGRLGVTTEFVDATDLAAVKAALAAAPTRLLYVETISNPTIVVVDLAALATLAHAHGALLIVDNTFASPYLCRPIELGADLVAESATKFIGGHSDVMAGVVAGSRERIAAVRLVEIDTGGTLSPLSAFLVLRGLTTLALRMERHAATASALATWLESEPAILRVLYPGLASHPQRELAQRQFPIGGGMLAFEVVGGRAGGGAFINALTIPELTASLGSIHTIVAHPPTTTHRQLADAELVEAGIAPGLLRCSVGLEDLADLRADFAAGLAAAQAAAEAAPEAAGSTAPDAAAEPAAVSLGA